VLDAWHLSELAKTSSCVRCIYALVACIYNRLPLRMGRTLHSTTAVLLIIGVTLAASDVSRLLCEYQCAEPTEASNPSGAAVVTEHQHHEDSNGSSGDKGLNHVTASTSHHSDCGAIDSLTVANPQQVNTLPAQASGATASTTGQYIGLADSLIADTHPLGSSSHSPPGTPVEPFTTLRI
jgi:hypothetical protein